MKRFVCLFLLMRGGVWAQELPSVTPSLHAYGVVGASSAEEPGEFAAGAHDPNRKEAWMLQSVEPGLSLRWGEHLRGFATASFFTDEHDDVDWEWEEYFLKLEALPGGVELRGGRFLNRVGLHNATHLHSWETVDAPLPHALLLGDEGLSTKGGEINFHLDSRHPTVLSLSFGSPPSHAHAHGHEEEHEEEHGEEDEHEHGHGEGHEALEAFRISDDLLTAGLRRQYRHDDFHAVTLAVFGGRGDNEEGGDTWFYGAGAEYEWRENGFDPGGRRLRARVEYLRLASSMGHGHEEENGEEHEEHEEEEEEGDVFVSLHGVNAQVVYEMNERLHPFARIDALGSEDSLDLSSWMRYTAGITFPLTEDPGVYLRVQGNADERGDESEQSLWMQVGFTWGGAEVR